jgi:hypothetical protein
MTGYHYSIYLSGRLDTGEATIAELATELEDRGHRILEPWWTMGRLPKPYIANPETSGPAAEAMIRAAHQCDVFILFPTNDILGAAVEFGAALAAGQKEIYVIGAGPLRQSVFYAHPRVKNLASLAELRQEAWF